MTARPRLEVLEAREVPVTTIWTAAVDTDFDNPSNWTNGVPGEGDDVVFVGSILVGDPEAPSVQVTNYDCDGMHAPSSGYYDSVTVASTYGATITLAGGFTTVDFTLEGGTVDQPSPTTPWANTDITVTGDFDWTDGELNSTDYLANLTISGENAAATFAPDGGGTILCGSSITFEEEASGRLEEGTIEFTNDGCEINIEEDSELEADPGTSKTITIDKSNDVTFGGQLNVKATGSLFRMVSGIYDSASPAKITGGRFILEPGTGASFAGHVDQVFGAPSYKQTGGTTFIGADATLKVALTGGGMLVGGGSLCFQGGTTPSNIEGGLKIEGGDIISYDNSAGGAHVFAGLFVKGNVVWTGGTFRPFVSTVNDDSDTWVIDGTLTIGGTAAVAPGSVNAQNQPTTPQSGSRWAFIAADDGIAAAANTPTLIAGYAYEKDPNNPQKWWDLKYV